MIWPFHTMVGTLGHNLSPSLYEAICYHSAARQSQPLKLTKGFIPQTEHYSILEPEVKVADHPQGSLNRALLQRTERIRSGLSRRPSQEPLCPGNGRQQSCARWRLVPSAFNGCASLEDGMSSVVVPGIDFEAMADEVFQRHRDAGLTFTRTSEAIG